MKSLIREILRARSDSLAWRILFLSWYLILLSTHISSSILHKISSHANGFFYLSFFGTNQFEQDTVLIPKETSWFGYYPDGAFKPVLAPEQVLTCCWCRQIHSYIHLFFFSPSCWCRQSYTRRIGLV